MGGRKDCWYAPIGTSFDAQRWRSLDPSGLMGISCSLGVHFFAYGTIAFYLIEGSFFATAVFLLIYNPVAFLALASLYMAWVTDPGAVPMGARPLVTVKRASSGEIQESQKRHRALRRCHKCNDNFKPSRAHHDSVTGRCIVKFDHFCPWVGNSVGALNHKFFVLFVGYSMCTCLLTLILMVVRAINCGYSKSDSSEDDNRFVDNADLGSSWNTSSSNSGSGSSSSANGTTAGGEEDEVRRFLGRTYQEGCERGVDSMAVLILLVVSVIFLIFTCCMLFEQIEAIETNSSKIARMQMRVGRAGTELARVTEEFNEMFGGNSNAVAWHWFFPLSVEFPGGMKKVVMGYEWDETFDSVPYEEPSRDEEEGGNGRIELTSTAGAPNSSNQLPTPGVSPLARANSTTTTTSQDGEEGTFSGTPVVSEKPKLTKRASSKDRIKASKGTKA